MEDQLKERLTDFFAESCKLSGHNDLSCRIFGLLYMEPEEIPMEEIARRLGYSLSATSTALKPLLGSGWVKKVKKPGLRKAYFLTQKNPIGMTLDLMNRSYNNTILKVKEVFPNVIREYKQRRPAAPELKIAEEYYHQAMQLEGAIVKFMDMLKAVKNGKKV